LLSGASGRALERSASSPLMMVAATVGDEARPKYQNSRLRINRRPVAAPPPPPAATEG
jgi:hypothetical protein